MIGYRTCTVAVVSIVSRCGLSTDAHHENQPNQHKLALYKLSIHFNCRLKRPYISSKMQCFSYKGVTCIKAFKRRASFDYIL